jgi:hypothetical protein
MKARRVGSGIAATVLVVSLLAPGLAASAQTPRPRAATADENAAIVAPLREIGRVKARTPYCAALAKARPGIDAALTFEYAMPIVARDLKNYRLDNELAKSQSLRKTEDDLSFLSELVTTGRAEVLALRTAANADPDEQRRREMLALANSIDAARARQKLLTSGLARVAGVLAEKPVHTFVNKGPDRLNQQGDDASANAFDGRREGIRNIVAFETPSPAYTQTQANAIDESVKLGQLFNTFSAEKPIRDDMQAAAQHATAVMQLGGCNATP